MLDWSVERYEEAIIRLQAKNGYKVTREDVELEKKAKPSSGFILGRGENFWRKLAVDGVLSRDAVLSKGYKPEQIPDIQGEMKRLKWL